MKFCTDPETFVSFYIRHVDLFVDTKDSSVWFASVYFFSFIL